MRATTLTAVVLFALPAAAYAQTKREERLYPDTAQYTELSFALSASMPRGNMFDTQKWDDFYSLGLGLEVQYTNLYKASPGFYGGWYGGLALESFGGRRHSLIDPTLGNVELKSDRLNLIGAEIGVRFREDFKTFHFDQNIGVGATFYSGADVEQTGVSGSAKFIDAGAAFLFTVGARVAAPIGDGVELGLGISYRLNGAPREGEDVRGLLTFKPLQEFVFALTLDFLF